MKTAYNILLFFSHTICAVILLSFGYARMLAWLNWAWFNDLVYLLAAAAALSGHWLLLQWGRKREWLAAWVLRILAGLDYVFFSLQLALTLAFLVWELAAPLLTDHKTFSVFVLLMAIPLAAVDISVLVFRQKANEEVLIVHPQNDPE